MEDEGVGIRINRFLSEAGVCSRRDADQLLFARAITVNGTVVDSPAVRIHPEKDVVKVSGKRVAWPPHFIYILLNKPEGVISTVEDPKHRPTVVEMLRGVGARVFPVGRLDFNTSGLLLMTNDGELALQLTHPRYEFPKTYHAKVEGIPSPMALRKLAMGVHILAESGRYEKSLPAKIRLLARYRRNAMVELTLREGRKHQVRKMLAAIGHPVIKLTRVGFGFLTLAGLPSGTWRYLTSEEVKRLKNFSPPEAGPGKGAEPRPHPSKPSAPSGPGKRRRDRRRPE